MEYEYSCRPTNIYNKVNTSAYTITFYPSDARTKYSIENHHRSTLRKLNSSAFLLIESQPFVNKEHKYRSLVNILFDGTNIETCLNSSLSAAIVEICGRYYDDSYL